MNINPHLTPVCVDGGGIQEPDWVAGVVEVEVEGDAPHEDQAERELHYLETSLVSMSIIIIIVIIGEHPWILFRRLTCQETVPQLPCNNEFWKRETGINPHCGNLIDKISKLLDCWHPRYWILQPKFCSNLMCENDLPVSWENIAGTKPEFFGCFKNTKENIDLPWPHRISTFQLYSGIRECKAGIILNISWYWSQSCYSSWPQCWACIWCLADPDPSSAETRRCWRVRLHFWWPAQDHD